jgi:3-phosphoshikimate 1-carboxyvinyltransferase
MPAVRVRTLARPVDAVVEVPGSKSIANRALICAALADGTSVLRGVPDGDDCSAMLDCLTGLGIGIGRDGDAVSVAGGVQHLAGGVTVDARLAGTTSRFVTALAALADAPVTIDGLPPLRARPMAPLHDALVALGARVLAGETWGHLPVTVGGSLRRGGTVELPGDVSSQYLSALMMIGPCLEGGLTLRMMTPLVSRPYLTMTGAVMASFGIDGVSIADDVVSILTDQYLSVEQVIEPDASSASYPLAVAALRGGRVTIAGLTGNSLQGDAVFADLLARMGCAVQRDAAGTTVERTGELIGIDVDLADHSDLVPTLAVVATAARTPTTIRGVGFIRGKESDRIGDLCGELRRAGVRAVELSDGLRIEPSIVHPARLDTHHDHRLAMAFAVLGTANEGIEVGGPDAVTKSWPGFWTMLDELGT